MKAIPCVVLILSSFFLSSPLRAEPVYNGWPLSAWIGRLKAPHTETRMQAADALASLRAEAAVPVLCGSILRMPAGWLADRYGGRIVFMGIMVASTVPAILLGYVTNYTALLVVGFCGGLDDASVPGEVIVADEVYAAADEGHTEAPVSCALRDELVTRLTGRGLKVRSGSIVCVSRLALGERRAELHAGGAIAVDMESVWLAGAAGDRPGPALVGPAGSQLEQHPSTLGHQQPGRTPSSPVGVAVRAGGPAHAHILPSVPRGAGQPRAAPAP